MANKKISDFNETLSASTSSIIPIVESGSNFKITKANLLKEVNENLNNVVTGLTSTNEAVDVIEEQLDNKVRLIEISSLDLETQDSEGVSKYLNDNGIVIDSITSLIIIDIIEPVKNNRILYSTTPPSKFDLENYLGFELINYLAVGNIVYFDNIEYILESQGFSINSSDIVEIKTSCLTNRASTLSNLTNVTKIEAPLLVETYESGISNNPNLVELKTPSIQFLRDDSMRDLPKVTKVDVSNVTIMNSGSFENLNTITELRLDNLVTHDPVNFGGGFGSMPALKKLYMNNFTEYQFSLPSSNTLTEIYLNSLPILRGQSWSNVEILEINNVEIIEYGGINGTKIETLNAPSLTIIRDGGISNNQFLKEINAPLLDSVTATIGYMPNITGITLSNLVNLSGNIVSMPLIDELDFSSLITFDGNISNMNITELVMPLATGGTGSLNTNTNLTNIVAPNVLKFGGIQYSPSLTTINFPNVIEISGSFEGLDSLTTLNLPSLTTIYESAFDNLIGLTLTVTITLAMQSDPAFVTLATNNTVTFITA